MHPSVEAAGWCVKLISHTHLDMPCRLTHTLLYSLTFLLFLSLCGREEGLFIIPLWVAFPGLVCGSCSRFLPVNRDQSLTPSSFTTGSGKCCNACALACFLLTVISSWEGSGSSMCESLTSGSPSLLKRKKQEHTHRLCRVRSSRRVMTHTYTPSVHV